LIRGAGETFPERRITQIYAEKRATALVESLRRPARHKKPLPVFSAFIRAIRVSGKVFLFLGTNLPGKMT
jgi:hypothetical protein